MVPQEELTDDYNPSNILIICERANYQAQSTTQEKQIAEQDVQLQRLSEITRQIGEALVTLKEQAS